MKIPLHRIRCILISLTKFQGTFLQPTVFFSQQFIHSSDFQLFLDFDRCIFSIFQQHSSLKIQLKKHQLHGGTTERSRP